MNARFFRNSIVRSRSYLVHTHRRHLATATQPPVLLLAEVHSRPAARHALCDSLPDLKKRGYNMLMREGIKSGKSLEEELLREQEKKELINKLIRRNPSLVDLMQHRYQLSYDRFSEACKKELSEISLKWNASNCETLMNFMMLYDESSIFLYNQLISNSFSYQNLDENHNPSIFQPLGSRRDLDFRDAQYANIISDAYKQGKGVISILGGLHILPDSQSKISDYLYNKIYGKRQLIGDRLRLMGIPCIGLFPFRSDHTPIGVQDVTWQKQLYYSSPNIDSSSIYSIDTIGSLGKKQFLDAIDSLIVARENQRSDLPGNFIQASK